MDVVFLGASRPLYATSNKPNAAAVKNNFFSIDLFFCRSEIRLIAGKTVDRVLKDVLNIVDLERVADIRFRGDGAAFDERKLLALDEEDGLFVTFTPNGGADEGDVRREVVDISAESHLHEAGFSFGGFFVVVSDELLELVVEDEQIKVFICNRCHVFSFY